MYPGAVVKSGQDPAIWDMMQWVTENAVAVVTTIEDGHTYSQLNKLGKRVVLGLVKPVQDKAATDALGDLFEGAAKTAALDPLFAFALLDANSWYVVRWRAGPGCIARRGRLAGSWRGWRSPDDSTETNAVRVFVCSCVQGPVDKYAVRGGRDSARHRHQWRPRPL